MVKKVSAFSFALLASVLLASSESSGVNLLVNGSFEDGAYVNNGAGYMGLGYGPESTTIPGWTVKDIDWMGVNGYWVASEGSFSIDMNGAAAGYIKQEFATAVGQTYTVSFDLAGNSHCGGLTKALRVSAAGSQQDYTHATGWADWVAETFEFTATAASTTLRFYSLETVGDLRCGAIIDNVRAEADQPPPPVNQAPNVSAATPSIASIWPPNNKMVPITINGVTDPDGDAVSITITAITNNETGTADAAFSGGTAQVRASRNGKGSGRTYTISFTADDGKGGTSSSSVTVVVPHDQGKRAKPTAVESATWGQVKSTEW